MTPRPAHVRSGITLTEILISILIMGVGLISLATLFPIGMVRLRQAQQQSRSGLLAETAAADLGTKNLLFKPSFIDFPYNSTGLDPFLYDNGVAIPINSTTFTSHSFTGSGLPICYDPLFWTTLNQAPGLSYEARFGAGIVNTGGSFNNFLGADYDSATGLPSAYGLQRITNFLPWTSNVSSWPFLYPNPNANFPNPNTLRNLAGDTFVSAEDVVMQNNATDQQILAVSSNTTGTTSSVVPMMFPVYQAGNANQVLTYGTQADWRYTWLFTGRQHDVTNGTVFAGDIVIMDSRPIAVDTVTSPISGTSSTVPSGEIVMFAIFGYGSTFPTKGAGVGYATGADRTVLLRWPSNTPDPEIKAGSWIADVTYERNQAISDTRANYAAPLAANLPPVAPIYPMQRCHWYQIARKGDVQASAVAGYREMVVYTNSPIRSRTLLTGGPPATPVFINVALFMPSVVNVFSRTIYVR